MAAFICRNVGNRFLRNVPLNQGISIPNQILNLGVCSLYESKALGVDGYVNSREKIAQQFHNMQDKFRTRMQQYLKSQTENLIFTDDLKNMLHLVKNDEADLTLCLQMMKQFNKQNKELRFGTYVFGPVFMRMIHYLGLSNLGFQAVKDQALDGLFDQNISYQILMDLLFEHGKYSEVLETFHIFQSKQLQGLKYPRECVVLYLAACYKLNTPESFDLALKLIKEARQMGATILRRGISFAAALALKQNNPKITLEILALTPQRNYITIRNLRICALLEMDRVDDVMIILQDILQQDIPDQRRKGNEICKETMVKFSEAAKRLQSKEFDHKLKHLEKALEDGNHLSPSSLDEILCTPIPFFIRPESSRYRREGDMMFYLQKDNLNRDLDLVMKDEFNRSLQ